MIPKAITLPPNRGNSSQRVAAFWGGGVGGGAERMKRLMRLIETRRVDPTPLTTHRFPFRDIERGFRMMETKEDGILKPQIQFD